MNKNGIDIFVGEFDVSNDKGDVDERSELSSDSSPSEERYRKTSKRVEKVRTTPGSTITLKPDAFRGAMNPEESTSISNGMLRNQMGDKNPEESGNGLNNSSMITPNERYDPSANGSGDETTHIHRKRKHRKNRKCGRYKRVETKFKRGGYYNMLVKFLDDEPGIPMDDRSAKVVTYTCNTKETLPVEFYLPRKWNDVLGLSE